MEFADNEENQANDDPDRDSRNKRIFRESLDDSSPHWTKNLLMSSTIVIVPYPENLVKSSTLYR